MMNMKNVTLVMLVIMLTSHSTFAQKSGSVDFNTFESDAANSNKITFCMDVPEGYKRVKVQTDIHSGLENKVIYYQDSSLIYIGNNIYEGSILNFQNRLKAGFASFSKDSDLDTVKMSGLQSNGNFWREDVIGRVVIGYLNVPPDKKVEYDKALATLRRKK